MQLLKPIIPKTSYTKAIEKVIERFLLEFYINPLMDIIKPVYEYYNDSTNNIIIEAIQKHQIQYVNGKFYGKFNAEITKALIKLGAKWNKRTKTFDITKNKLSMDILGSIGQASVLTLTMRKMILDFLDSLRIEDLIPNLAKWLQYPLDMTLEELDGQSYNTFFKWQQPKEATELKEKFIKDISVSPEKETKTDEETQQEYERAKLSNAKREFLKKEYTENVTLSIKNFTDKQTIRLRQIVEQNTLYGLSNKSLVETIQKEFKTSLSKAKFLARNEMGIFTAKYQEAKARELGYTKYVWYGANDERERPMHKQLNGLVFDYDHPPVVNEKGEHKNPGEDYNCRCTARLILPYQEQKIKPSNQNKGELGSFNLNFFRKNA